MCSVWKDGVSFVELILSVSLNSLDLKQLDISFVPNRRILVTQVDDAPHVCAEPQSRALIGLVLADEDGMRNRQQTHQSPVLQKLQDLRLVRQTFVYADFLHLRHQHLQESHYSL